MLDEDDDNGNHQRRFEGMNPEEQKRWRSLEFWFLKECEKIFKNHEDRYLENHPSYECYDPLHALRLQSIVEKNTSLPQNHPNKWSTVEGLIAAATGIVGVDEVGRPIMARHQIIPSTQAMLAGNVYFQEILQRVLGVRITFTPYGIPTLPHSNLNQDCSIGHN